METLYFLLGVGVGYILHIALPSVIDAIMPKKKVTLEEKLKEALEGSGPTFVRDENYIIQATDKVIVDAGATLKTIGLHISARRLAEKHRAELEELQSIKDDNNTVQETDEVIVEVNDELELYDPKLDESVLRLDAQYQELQSLSDEQAREYIQNHPLVKSDIMKNTCSKCGATGVGLYGPELTCIHCTPKTNQ